VPPIPVVAGDGHRGHDPPHEVDLGRVVRPVYERPARAERLRAALTEAGHPLVAAAGHGLAPVLAVHDRALVEFLEGAYAAWRAAGGPRTLIPDTFALTGLGRGAGAAAAAGGTGRPGRFCFDTATPLVAGSWRAAREAVDVALTGADLLAGGAGAAYALCRPPGHHAGPGYYGGFCLLNNAAVAAAALRRLGRVAVVDVDFHHGNGTQDVFWEDPGVLYVSLHGDPAGHYPHFTGTAAEAGGGPGTGATRNLPLPDGTGDEDYLAALATAAEAVAGFGAEVMVVSLGFDTLDGDPIGAFRLTPDGFGRVGRLLAGLGLPALLVQEGGYALEAIGGCAVAALTGFQAGMSGLS
jgi:acetoin utilization deacetylase AcuC-like enzyme